MVETRKPEIPPHTKWGIRVTTVIILLISVMVIKNCMGSFMYGISTRQETQQQYYDLGFTHGLQKAQGMGKPPEPETKNLLLRKLYRKGYRDGWDSFQPKKKSQNSSSPLKQTGDLGKQLINGCRIDYLQLLKTRLTRNPFRHYFQHLSRGYIIPL